MSTLCCTKYRLLEALNAADILPIGSFFLVLCSFALLVASFSFKDREFRLLGIARWGEWNGSGRRIQPLAQGHMFYDSCQGFQCRILCAVSLLFE